MCVLAGVSRAGYYRRRLDPPAPPPSSRRPDPVRSMSRWMCKVDLTGNDNATAQAYRGHYAEAKAKAPPSVIQCDTMAGDTWFHGIKLGERATAWTALWTGGKGTYCTTQQEDNATYMALSRGAISGLVDLNRVAVLRRA
jgi:purine nucleoside permease